MQVEDELKTYLQVIWRYKKTIAACAVIASVVALVISLILTPLYSGTATVRVASAPGGTSDYTYISSLTRLSNTYVEIATSDVSLDEVARRLGLAKRPAVEVEVVPETELIKITATDPNPERASSIANTLANLMVEQSMQLYGGNAPTAREILEAQLQQAKVDLDNAVAEYDAALRSSQSTSTRSTSSTPSPNPDVQTLADLVSVRQQIYGDLLVRYEAARTNEQLRANAITIVEPASIAVKPSTPNIPLNAALGLVAGLILGVILAFVFEGMDDTLRGIEDVQAITPLSILSQIPERKKSPALSQNGNFLPLPAFHQLSTRLLLSEAMENTTSLLITSPEPGAGKSTIAANLALSLARAGYRVVLLDMDFHRPRQHSIFHLSNEKGLCDFLSGKVKLEATLQNTQFPKLRIAVAGSSLDGITDKLSPDNISAILERLNKEAEYILIDAPAFLSVAEPALIASRVGAVIMVVAQRRTGRGFLNQTLQQLTELNAKIAGIVLNKAPDSRLSTYYSQRSSKIDASLKKDKTNLPEKSSAQ